tara:strand:- start:4814 stop:5686 length:873 start_codon:yes stop_codon:yes gene_type:complete
MINILITESGGPAAVGLIKSIKQLPYKVTIVAVDMDELAVGNYLSDYHYQVPKASDSNYIDNILNIINKHNIKLIIPTGENDLQSLSKNIELFKNIGCKLFISNLDTIKICQNKFKFWEHLNKKFKMPLPLNGVFLKPDVGVGGRGTKKIEASKGSHLWEFLPGKEYTVDVFCDMNSNIINHVIRERIAIKSGISVKGKIISNLDISFSVKKLVKHLDLKGPLCIQYKENELGEPFLIECNPRLGGGTYMCTLAGINYAEIYFNLLRGVENTTIDPKKITVLRYYNEIII